MDAEHRDRIREAIYLSSIKGDKTVGWHFGQPT